MSNFQTPIEVAASITGWANGASVTGSGVEIPVYYPATGGQVSTLIEDGPDDVDRAVASARKAFDQSGWPQMSIDKRIEVLEACEKIILDNIDELGRLECLATGLVMTQINSFHLPRAAYNFRFFAQYISQAHGERYDNTPGYVSTVKREPAGVVGLIAPWNAPIALATMKIAAALAFGNCAVLKPSEQTPFSLVKLVSLLNEVLPDGVLNLVNGRGPVTGSRLVSHPDIDRISFTGGTITGREVMAAAGRQLTPCTMELGGKSANIIFASADFDRALDSALLSIFSTNGQQCLAGSRILVEETIFDDFVAAFTARMARIKVGDPLAADTEVGPIASKAHMERILSFVDSAARDGDRLLGGGKRREALGNGYFIDPTAVVARSNASSVCQQEIFGPFASFLTFKTEEQAINIANDTEFGLVSYVWSDHVPTVMNVSEKMRSGVVWVNTPLTRELRAPFGGYKNSGVGREGGHSCEEFFTEEKTISIPKAPLDMYRFGA
ncbi:MAG: aldehyde dehydrogenase family protein [Bacteroidetes bacterium]|nr:aldehyde dehydrogenase family protein [Bacteroidota bacterium]